MNLSIIIPTRNESDNIKETIKELLSTIAKIPDIDNTKITVVDDCSEDNTSEIVKALNDPRITYLRLSKRSGTHSAIRAGLKKNAQDVVLCISADGQDDPSCLKDMISKLRKGAKIVWALRKDRKNEPWHTRMPAQFFYKILSYLDGCRYKNIDMSRADFFLLDRIAVNAVNKCSGKNIPIFALLVWLEFDQDFVEYNRRLRRSGRSKWNFCNRMCIAINWILAAISYPRDNK